MKNRNKTILLLVIVAVLLSCCLIKNVSADIEQPQNIVNLDYRDFEYIMIDSTQIVNLSFIGSSSFNETAVTIEKIQYYPDTNETKYKIISNNINPGPWYNPDIEDFVYQDTNTGQLYIIQINYNGIDIPLSQIEQNYNVLLSQYTNLSLNYSTLSTMYDTLWNTTTEINNTLSEYLDTANETITEGVNRLYNDFKKLQNNIQNLNITLKNLEQNYKKLQDKYSSTSNNLKNITEKYMSLKNSYQELNEIYNETYNILLSKGANLSLYKNFEEDLNGYGEGFYFNGRYYNTISTYNDKIQSLEDELGWTPIYIALSVVLTILILFGIYKYYLGEKIQTSMEIEDQYGYDPETHKINVFSLTGKLKDIWNKTKKIGKTKKDNGEHIAETTVVSDDDNNGEDIDIESVRTEIDNQIDKKIQPLQKDISDIHSNIDKILAKI